MTLIIIYALVAVGCFAYSMFAFQQKGPLLLTMYLVANQEERKKMKTRAEYYFVGTVFLWLSIIFSTLSVGVLFELVWMITVTIGLALFLVIYVIVSSIKSEINRKV